MVVIEMHQQRRQEDALLAAFMRARLHAVQAVEKPVEVACRVRLARLSRQAVHRLVRRAQGARRRLAGVVLAKRLIRPPFSSVTDEIRQFALVVVSLHGRSLAPPTGQVRTLAK